MMHKYLNNPKTHAYRVTVAIAFGLIGFGVNFPDIDFMEGAAFKISILAGLFFPLVVSLAWGWRYGLLSALAGGCQTMWWLGYGDGWGVVYSVPVFTLWIVWHGWWAERRSEGHPWYVSSFMVEIPFRIVIELGFLVVFRWLVSLNPPPWNPAISWDQVSSVWLQTVTVKHAVEAYVLLMAAYVALSLGSVRRFFGLTPWPAQRDTSVIYAGAALFGLLLWMLDVLVDYFVFPHEGQTFWGIAVHGTNAHEMFMRSIYVMAALLAGVVLVRLNRRRVELQELLDHRNRILAAIRNVNQLIVREKDPHRLLDEACRLLVETYGYYNVWIVLTADGRPREPFFHAGFNGGFAPIAERLRAGDLPICEQAALSSNGLQIKEYPPAQCTRCPLTFAYAGRAGLSLRLEHAGHLFGWIRLSCPAQEKLKQSHAMLARTEHIANIGSWEWDIDADRVRWSDELFRIFQRDSACGAPSFAEHPDIYVTEDMDRLRDAVETCISKGIPYELELRAIRKDGMIRQCVARGQAECDGTGRIIRLVGSLQDITDRKRIEAETEKIQTQLNQAQKMESIGRLAGGVAHDFNNMLGVILGHVELALEKTGENNDLHADLKEIQTAARRSADLTKQLLTFARKQIYSPRQLDLNQTVENMLNMLRRLIGEDIDLVWQPSAHLWPVKMDPSQIDQILANLCVNARDAIAGVGKLTIETGRKTFDEEYCSGHQGFVPGDFVLLAVSDNGCGMDTNTLKNLFEPFFTTKAVGKGTGLGLATIYGIVKQNNGFINVYSEPGQGSTFKIYLPRLVADEDTDKAIPDKKAAVGGTETILLVEDEPAILNMVRMILERKGYSVLSAATPAEAIALAKIHADKIHLLMTDVVMPEMNGRDLAMRLTALYPDIKLLFMSGYTANVIAHQGMLDDGVAFIQKPFSIADLTEKVREVIEIS